MGYLSAAAAAGLAEEQLWAAAAGAGLNGAAPPVVSLDAPQSAALSLTAWTQTGGELRVEPDAPAIAAALRREGADVPAAYEGAFAFNVTAVSTKGVAVAAQRLLVRVVLPRGRLSPSAISAAAVPEASGAPGVMTLGGSVIADGTAPLRWWLLAPNGTACWLAVGSDGALGVAPASGLPPHGAALLASGLEPVLAGRTEERSRSALQFDVALG